MQTGRPRVNTGMARALSLVVFVFAFLAAFHTLINADYWFHLRAGSDVAGGSIPRVDSYSFPSSGRPYVDLHWLFQLFLYGIHQLGGVKLAIWVKAVLVGVTFVLVYFHAARQSAPGVAAVAAILGVVLASERFMVRPEIFTFLLLAVLLLVLQRYRDRPGSFVWWIPLLFVLWVNSEGIFVVGIGALGAHVLEQFRDRRLWLVLAASIVATLLNPFFVEGALHPLVLFTRIDGSIEIYSTTIGEFLSAFDASVRHPAAYLFPWYLGLLALALLASRRPRISEIIIVAAFVFLSFKARRNLAILAIGTAPILARWLYLAREAAPISKILESAGPSARRTLTGAFSIGFAAATVLYVFGIVTDRTYAAIESNRSFGAGLADIAFSPGAAAFLRETDPPQPIFSTLSVGSYLMGAAPEYPVFIDGRLEVHSTEHFDRYIRMLREPAVWESALTEFGFQTVVLDHGAASSLTSRMIRDGSWSLCYLDGQVIILVRRTPENEAYLAANQLGAENIENTAAALKAAGPGAPPLLPPNPGPMSTLFGSRSFPWAEISLGQFLFRIGAYDRAAEQYRLAIQCSPHVASPRVLLAAALNQLRRPDEALEVLESAADRAGTESERDRVRVTRGDILVAMDRHAEALENYNAYLATKEPSPETATARTNRAMAKLGLGDFAGAAEDATQAVTDLPNFAEAYRHLGRAREGLGETAAALQAYETYAQLGGQNPTALEALERLRASSSPK